MITRYPLPNTILDFWRLINDHEIDTIILHGSSNAEEVISVLKQYNDNSSKRSGVVI